MSRADLPQMLFMSRVRGISASREKDAAVRGMFRDARYDQMSEAEVLHEWHDTRARSHGKCRRGARPQAYAGDVSATHAFRGVRHQDTASRMREQSADLR